MCKGNFSSIISNNFQEIKKTFKSGLRNSGYIWDEDIFMDTYIKCDNVLGDRIMDKTEALKYFWTAYINKLKNYYKSKYSIMEYIRDDYDMIDEEYNTFKDILCYEIYKRVEKEFGEEIANAWVDHKAYRKSVNEIMKKYGFKQDFHYTLRKIKKYINEIIMNDFYIIEISDNVIE